jgi:hypothetical protein
LIGDREIEMELNRRQLLAIGGGAVAATVVGVPGAAAAAVAGGWIDLSVASEKYLREIGLHNNTVGQSLAFDNVNGHLYTIQVVQGGLQLPGESAPVSGADRAAHGDMCVTKLSLSGARLGFMYLKGFGHGVSFGVEPAGSTPYLWTESDNNPDSGYGRAISRFKFVSGSVLSSSSSTVTKLYPVPGSTSNQPSVDMLNRRLLLRYRTSSGARYALYDLAEATAGRFAPIYDIPQVGILSGETFQGFALFGDYVYQMTGTAYTDESGSNPPSGHGNTYVSCVDLRTGALVQRSRTEAAYSLTFREPEGLAIQLTSPYRLCMGFASGVSGARKYSVYYKPQS